MRTHDSTGWRRPIGCLKLQVMFRKRATNLRALLRKMTCKDKASYDVSITLLKHHRVSHAYWDYDNTDFSYIIIFI